MSASEQTRRYLDADPMLPGLRRLVDLARNAVVSSDNIPNMSLLDGWRGPLGDLVDVLDRGIERTDHPDDRGRYADALSCLLAMFFETEVRERAYLAAGVEDRPAASRDAT